MVDSAPTYASLAGLLAGFQFAALSILFASGKAKDTHTIGLFSAGLFTMGLDSFLFAQLSGLPKPLTGGLCRLGWGQAITAGGMLAVGSVALICGLVWLLALRENFSLQQRTYLMRLGGLLAGGMVFVGIYRLCIALVSYLLTVFPSSPAAGDVSIMAVGAVVGAIFAAQTVARIRRSSLTDDPKPESLVRLSRATTFVVGYAVIAMVFATALAWFETISPDSNLANAARVSATVLVGTILPGLVIYLLARSMGKDRDVTAQPWRRASRRRRHQPAGRPDGA
ncbi:hypothetical protein A5787_14515 [Mycobacterium sp. 852002-50816_SCH5313054-b]|uniref:hypothetical protein n=1 Tax=Mycobacterium sp. 852002-50816_SCH5313054-b TaxID=1834092 RepID=UPI0007FBCCA0|nr:hypothetical protein [Mycobacterium sp. 852002-50816_SCH5313054-b]OBF43680.1 hypothetical protein A5787_14515 [Mycobacterium sp. 852002-50816_SCH5313054-b]